MIVTFYSFKGGVGRSMALANVGEILADWGYSVIVCDWDLEAPGLERYLASTAEEATGLISRPGLMDLVREYKDAVAAPPEPPTEAPMDAPEGRTDPEQYAAVGSLRLRRPSAWAFPIGAERRRAGTLHLLTAGARGPEHYPRYAQEVRSFDWEEFYRKWAGDAYVEFLRKDLEAKAQIVLLDSRTGVTEHGGICTHHLADLVVLVSASNEMSLAGTRWMADALASPRLVELRRGRDLALLPVASRIEQTAQKEELVDFRNRFQREFRAYVPDAVGSVEDFFLRAEIPYMPFYSLTERVVAREPEDRREKRLYSAYQALSEALVRCGVQKAALPAPFWYRPTSETESRGPEHRIHAEPIRVFLSHAWEARNVAAQLAAGLEGAGAEVWWDQHANQSVVELDEAMARSSVFLWLVGRESLTPGWLSARSRAEVTEALRRQALDRKFRVVPCLVPGVELPGRLGSSAVFGGVVRLPSEIPPPENPFFRQLAARFHDETPALAQPEGARPYPGLFSYDEENARFFFGRDAEVREVISRLAMAPHVPRWLHVEGASGIGKTSVVKAGVIPAIRRGLFAGAPREWKVATCRPGNDALGALAQGLHLIQPAGSPAALREHLTRAAGAFLEIARQLAANGHGLVLLIDQLEELFLEPANAVDLPRLDEVLALALESSEVPFVLLTTVRSDFADRMSSLPRLTLALQSGGIRYLLGPMKATGIREAILGPASAAGLTVEPGLVERLITDLDAAEHPPLLAAILQMLWAERSGRVLTNEAYDRLGGPTLIARQAEQLVGALSEEQREQARRLLLALVAIGPGGEVLRRSLTLVEVLAAAGGGRDAELTLVTLSGGRLLATRVVTASPMTGPSPVAGLPVIDVGGDRVTLAHEVLVRDWPRLATWIEAGREQLRRRDELQAASLAWERAGQPDSGLPLGSLLAYYEVAPVLSAHAIRFLTAARARRDRMEAEARVAARKTEESVRRLRSLRWAVPESVLAVGAIVALAERFIGTGGAVTSLASIALSAFAGAVGTVVPLVVSLCARPFDEQPSLGARTQLLLFPLSGAALGVVVHLILVGGLVGTWMGTQPFVLRELAAMAGMFAPLVLARLQRIAEVVLAPPGDGQASAPPGPSRPT